MNRNSSLRYTIRTGRLDQIWLPIAMWALFAIIILFVREDRDATNIGQAFLGGVLPLIGGILSAYSVLDDPALELQFTSPRSMARLLLERWGLVLLILAVTALTFQVFLAVIDIDLSLLGNLAVRQLAWLTPSLAMIGLGSIMAFSLSQATFGALAVGLAWFIEIMLRSWFISDPIAQYFFFFIAPFYPDHPAWLGNQFSVLGLAAAFAVCAWMLLKRQERYL